MSSDWVDATLGEFIDFKNGKSSPDRSDEASRPVFGSNGIIGYSNDSNAPDKSLIIGRVGSYCGSVYHASQKCWVTDNAILGLPKKSGESEFWYFLLLKLDLNSYRSGSGQPLLNQATLKSIPIKVPSDKEVRAAIGKKLMTFNNKIELNRQTNQTLEHIVQAIFKSWFVDFEPTRAKIAAKQHWQALHEVVETSSPTCYSETDDTAKPNIQGLDEAMNQAAMAAISGKTPEELQQLSPEQLQHLQSIAALFPDALVDSELGEIPEGWKINDLKTLSKKISKGTTPTKAAMEKADDKSEIPFLKVRDISNDGEISRMSLDTIPESIHETVLNRSKLEQSDLLFSIAGTIGRVALVEEDLSNSNCNQAIAFIRIKEPDKYLELTRLNLVGSRVQDEVVSKVVQGVQANFSLTGLGEICILIPSLSLLISFNEAIGSISKMQRLLLGENRKLAELRDSLLPKLLSGELITITPQTELEEIA